MVRLSDVFRGFMEDNATCVSVSGSWLNDFGFTVGRKVSIEITKGLIVVKLIDAEDYMGMVYKDYEQV